jgi:hypothetical protein
MGTHILFCWLGAIDLRAAFGRDGETILNQPLGQGLDLPKIMKTVAVHYFER